MKVFEDTPQRLVIISRRKIFADVAFLFFLGMGALISYAMFQENRQDFLNDKALFLGLLFVGIGVWGLLKNADDHVALDAATRTVTIERRRMFGRDTVAIPFSEVTRAFVHEDDDMHTIAFSVKDHDDILLQTTYGRNLQAAPLAHRLREWLQERGCPLDQP